MFPFAGKVCPPAAQRGQAFHSGAFRYLAMPEWSRRAFLSTLTPAPARIRIRSPHSNV